MCKTTFSIVAALCVTGAAAGQSAPSTPPPPPPAPAPDTQAVVTLTNGDILRGVLVSDGDPVVIDHPVLGRLSFNRADVSGVRTMSAANAGKATAAAVDAASKIPPPPPPPDPDSFFKGWKGSIGVGANGTSGNTETLNVRSALNLVRETSKTKTTADLVYNYATNDGDKSSDNGSFGLRNDWLPQGDSKWRPFAQGLVEYDQFQDWDYRTTIAGGIGYELIKTDKMLLLPRAGLGLSKEFGGSDNKIHPEGLLGTDFSYTIDERSKFFTNINSLWTLDELPAYRVYLQAGYEIMVDPASNLSLKLGIEEKYDSSPGEGRHRSDFSYFAMLAYSF